MVVETDGGSFPDGYWWLTYDWHNLYPICPLCNTLKGARFPIAGERAAVGTRGRALATEQPLLLDPCNDYPWQHLVFLEDGRVAGITDRGRSTCAVFGLNRDDLVRQRRATLSQLRRSLRRTPLRADVQLVEALAGDSTPFAAARRQLLGTLLLERGLAKKTDRSLANRLRLPLLTTKELDSAASSSDKAESAQERYSVADVAGKARYFSRARLIQRIEVRNFLAIEHLSVSFTEPKISESTSWLMLLGENGSGKSSLLKAVSLAIIGRKWRDALALDASRFVRYGATTGFVKVYLTGIKQPLELRFSRRSRHFKSDQREPKMLVLGYGPTRLLPNSKDQSRDYDVARVSNLFDPYESLNDATAWLGRLDDAQFDMVARALRPILQLGRKDKLSKTARGIEARLFGAQVSLNELSDGYQCVLALATDIMRVMLNRWEAMEIAEGIVILDEVGSHLHPRWRMRIVPALRSAFPRVQFIASTHDPLCLRGLKDGEVAVLSRDSSDRVAITTDLPPVEGLRVDQLLTSEYFGLNSTVDPAIDQAFQDYYDLLGARQRTPEQENRLRELKVRLSRWRLLGSNLRERLMLEAIDAYVVESRRTPTLRPKLRNETRRTLIKIWDRTFATTT